MSWLSLSRRGATPRRNPVFIHCGSRSAFASRNGLTPLAALVAALLIPAGPGLAQTDVAAHLAGLEGLRSAVSSSDTRTRVDAFHKAWTIALASTNSDVKVRALELLKEPAGSSSDHIRMPVVYAVVEIANSTADLNVKKQALSVLLDPSRSEQVPARVVVADAVNLILASAESCDLAADALQVLSGPVRSSTNGVRMPAINAIVRSVLGSNDDRAYNTALELLQDPLNSNAAIGGMEVRMMAVVAVERIGVEAAQVATKAKAMGMMQSYAGKGSWEPQAQARAQQAAASIKASIR